MAALRHSCCEMVLAAAAVSVSVAVFDFVFDFVSVLDVVVLVLVLRFELYMSLSSEANLAGAPRKQPRWLVPMPSGCFRIEPEVDL